MRQILAISFVSIFLSLAAVAGVVPDNCVIENWCVIKSSQCMNGQTTHPQGLYKNQAQYSLLRKFSVSCSDDRNYGRRYNMVIVGDVEIIPYSSAVETTEEYAKATSLQACISQRANWLEVAPICKSKGQ